MKKIQLLLCLILMLPLLPVWVYANWTDMDVEWQQIPEQQLLIDSADILQNPVFRAVAETRKPPTAAKKEFSLEKTVSGGCDLDTYESATIIAINAFPYTSAESGITVSAVENTGNLNNFAYDCGGNRFNTANPAWWLRYAHQYVTLTFSEPVSNFSVVVNGTNTNERFYFFTATGSLTLSNFCTNNFVATGNELRCTDDGVISTGTLITVNNPAGSTEYTIMHNGSGNGSRISLLDCFVKGIDCNDPNHELLPLADPWATTGIGQSGGSSLLDPCPLEAPQFVVNATGYSPNLNNDAIQLTYQTLCDNASITAHLTSVGGGGWAGVTMRESAATGSRMVALKTQLTNFIRREARSITNGPKSNQQMPGIPPPSWLRIQRSGNVFSYYTSTSGVSWNLAGTQTIVMNSCLLVGIFAESINVNTTTTAIFDNISVSGSGPVVPLLGVNNTGFDTQENLSPYIAPTLDGAKAHASTLTIYPNPSDGIFTIDVEAIKSSESSASLTVFDAQGKKVIQKQLVLMGQKEFVDLSSFPDGMYWLRIQTQHLAPMMQKLVKSSAIRP